MQLEGVIVPNLTPMDASGDGLAVDGIRGLVEFLLSKRVSALFVGGTTGEGPLLTVAERKVLAETVHGTVERRVPIAVQVGAMTTRESLELAIHAAEHGADAVACLTPLYFAYTDDELARFYLDVAAAVAPLPVYLYSIPARAGNAVSPALAERLAGNTNIVGIKDSSGDVAQLLNLLSIPGFRVVPGADQLIVQTLQAGAPGFVSGPAGVLPEPFVALWDAWLAQDAQAVLYWQEVTLGVSRILHYGARIDLLKAVASRRVPGIGPVRRPLQAAGTEQVAQACSRLRRLLEATTLPEEAYAWL